MIPAWVEARAVRTAKLDRLPVATARHYHRRLYLLGRATAGGGVHARESDREARAAHAEVLASRRPRRRS